MEKAKMKVIKNSAKPIEFSDKETSEYKEMMDTTVKVMQQAIDNTIRKIIYEVLGTKTPTKQELQRITLVSFEDKDNTYGISLDMGTTYGVNLGIVTWGIDFEGGKVWTKFEPFDNVSK
jgi:hypothetical protein